MIISMLIVNMLAELGCEIIGPVTRVREALCVIVAQSVDAAILDVNLDGEMSYPVADALAARGIPFLFSTGYERLKNGYNSWPTLWKPYDLTTLSAALEKLLSRTNPTDHNSSSETC